MWGWCRLSERKALDRLANATCASPASAALAGPVAVVDGVPIVGCWLCPRLAPELITRLRRDSPLPPPRVDSQVTGSPQHVVATLPQGVSPNSDSASATPAYATTTSRRVHNPRSQLGASEIHDSPGGLVCHRFSIPLWGVHVMPRIRPGSRELPPGGGTIRIG